MRLIRPNGIDSTVTLYLRMNGAAGAVIFYDDSQTKKTVTVYGGAQMSTTKSKFGGSSGYFDGTGDYLTLPTTNLVFVDGVAMTQSFWFNTSNVAQARVLLGTKQGDGTSLTGQAISLNSSNIIFQVVDAVTVRLITGTSPSANAWHHVAVVKNAANLFTLYLDGTSVGTPVTTSGTLVALSPLNIGHCAAGGSAGEYLGYIDELIIWNGIAKWTANFTPPTRQLI